jgi:hypothetical protein
MSRDMASSGETHAGLALPSPETALASLRRLMRDWELDQFDAASMVHGGTADLSAIEWSEARLLRAARLVELDEALRELNPRPSIGRWLATPKPGPFFEGNSPLQMLTGGGNGLRDLLRQVRQWSRERPRA